MKLSKVVRQAYFMQDLSLFSDAVFQKKFVSLYAILGIFYHHCATKHPVWQINIK